MNKKGWGLRVELVFVLLFLICLLTATIGLQKLGIFGEGDNTIDRTETKNNDSYIELENKLSDSAKRYYESTYPNGSSDTIIINYNSLKNNGYIDYLNDNYGRECNGYAKILRSGICVSYIRCTFYKTTGYSVEYE